MRWRLTRRNDRDRQQHAADLRDAEAQLRDAEAELEAAQERTSEIAEFSRTLRSLGEANHFAPLVLKAFGGGR